jgi:hypothetical protein
MHINNRARSWTDGEIIYTNSIVNRVIILQIKCNAYISKDTINKVKKTVTIWGKIFIVK